MLGLACRGARKRICRSFATSETLAGPIDPSWPQLRPAAWQRKAGSKFLECQHLQSRWISDGESSKDSSLQKTDGLRSSQPGASKKGKNAALDKLKGRKLRSIKHRLSSLERQMALSSAGSTISSLDAEGRKEIFVEAKDVLDSIRTGVEQGKIKPAGKDGRDVSFVLARILNLYAASFHEERDYSVFDECLWVLALLDDWNLNRQEAHYNYAISVGVHEKRWKHSAELFQQQIDRDASGFCPLSFVSVSSPQGLLAIARDAQESGKDVVGSVMDAVTNLSLLDPTNQDRHILAAGTAIGLAGEGSKLVSHLSDNREHSLGQVGAAMHACILSDKHHEALELFRTLTDGNVAISSEFHWGGGQDRMFPLCRDLAMRACTQSGTSPEGMLLLRQALDEELAVSEEALLGVLGACERDGDWKDAVSILLDIFGVEDKICIVRGAELQTPSAHDVESAVESQKSLIEKGKALSSVMRACNAAGEFGVALICFALLDTSAGTSVGEGSADMAMLGLLRDVDNSCELLSAMMIALCGVESFEQAQTLFELSREWNIVDPDNSPPEKLEEAEQVYQYAQACADSSANQRRWPVAHRHADRILRALHAIKMNGETLSPEQLCILGSGLAMVLRSCTGASQPAAGLVLCDFVTSQLALYAPKSTGSFQNCGLTFSDGFLAEKMKALEATDQKASALALLSTNIESFEGTPERWTQTTNAVLNVLAESGNVEESAVLFHRHVESRQGDNIDTFLTAAQIFADAGHWSTVVDTYHMALEKGCHSTPLGILAMKAVTETGLNGKLRISRGIIRDCSKATGTDPASWLDSRYWRIKHMLGFNDARLLMWWNDPSESQLEELDLFIDNFRKRADVGLQAKNGVLRMIVSYGRMFNVDEISNMEPGKYPRIPRDQSGWAELVKRVVEESVNMRNDVRFLDEASMALRHLGCNVECLSLVEEAVQRNVQVGKIAAKEALLAEQSLSEQEAT